MMAAQLKLIQEGKDSMDRQKALEAALAQIDRAFGKGSAMKLGSKEAMQVEAILPDGTNQIVSYVGNFNFNWMTNYIYDDDAAPVFPKGTIIHVSAWYDNTKANKFNPDPDQWVGYGDRTVDEMAHAWMNVVYLDDTEYKALLAERAARAQRSSAP